MDMRLKEDFLDRWKKYFGGAELPIACWYTDDEGAAVRAEPAKGHRCFIADLAKIRKGESLRFDVASIGTPAPEPRRRARRTGSTRTTRSSRNVAPRSCAIFFTWKRASAGR